MSLSRMLRPAVGIACIVAMGCGSSEPRSAPPTSARAAVAPTASASSATSDVDATRPSLAMSAAPSAVASASATPPPAPPCPGFTSLRPVGFLSTSSGAGLQFATPDAGLAPALLAVQKDLDAWAAQQNARGRKYDAENSYMCPCSESAGCSVVRSDGEILSVRCEWSWSGGGHFNMDGEARTYERRGDRLVLLSLSDMFPSGSVKAADAINGLCSARQGSSAGLDEHAIAEPLGELVYFLPDGDERHSAPCTLTYADLDPITGCNAIGRLRQPSDAVTPTDSPWPLEFYLEGKSDYAATPRFRSPDSRRKALADLLNHAVDEQARLDPGGIGCDVYANTDDIVSLRCPKGPSITYRTADNSPVTVQDLFAAGPTALKGALQGCFGRYLLPPRGGESYTQLTALPDRKIEDFSIFAVGQSSVRFDVAAADGAGTLYCDVPLSALGTNLATLAKPAKH